MCVVMCFTFAEACLLETGWNCLNKCFTVWFMWCIILVNPPSSTCMCSVSQATQFLQKSSMSKMCEELGDFAKSDLRCGWARLPSFWNHWECSTGCYRNPKKVIVFWQKSSGQKWFQIESHKNNRFKQRSGKEGKREKRKNKRKGKWRT